MEKLYRLFNNLKAVFEARGQPDYNKKLQLIPPQFHHKIHFLLQYAAQVSWSSKDK